MGRRSHGVTSGMKAVSLTRRERPVKTITVPGIGSAGYTPSELAAVDELKAHGDPATLLNELAVIHAVKVAFDATIIPPETPAETTERQEALFE